MADLNELMKQAKQMQEQFQKAQDKLSDIVVSGESGAGLVKIDMNGRYDVIQVELQDSLLSEEKELSVQRKILSADEFRPKALAFDERVSIIRTEQIKKEEAIIKQQVTMAVQNTKSIGNLPSDIKDIIKEMEYHKRNGT